VGFGVGLGAVAKRTDPCPCRGSSPGHYTAVLNELFWLIYEEGQGVEGI